MQTAVGISVMFTDLVGSTELSARLGAADAEELRQLHFTLIRDEARAHGGREVKNLGDGLMMVFPGVGAALDGAIAVQQAVERHNRSDRGAPLSLRIGVATGDAVEEDGDYFGEPVVQAARLCAQATGGQILAPEVVCHLAPRGRHAFGEVGPMELKGLPDPVLAVEVVWTPAVPGTAEVPLQARLTFPHTVDFVGRAAERAVLASAFKAAAAGEPRVVLLSGEPGMGKTRLASEVAAEAHAAGAIVLYGRCDEDLGIPYQPWAEALIHYMEHAPDGMLERHDRARLAELARLVPGLRRRLSDLPPPSTSDSAAERYVLFGSVASVLSDLGGPRPCVVLLDDLHWADRPTLQLLRHVVSSVTGAAVLVVGTYRDSDVGADHPLSEALAAMRREPSVERLGLSGLGDAEVVALLESVAGHEMDRVGVGLAHAVRAETDGNPYFVGELLRHLAESGAIAQQSDGRWVATVDLSEVGLPESVREVIGQRVRRLGEPARRLLGAAAVVGREFDLGLLTVAGDVSEDAALDIVEEAMAAGLVAEVPAETDRFTFTHALLQHTLYDELPTSRRVRLHRRIAEAIEQLVGDDPGDRVGELANHWLAATRPTEFDKAIDYAVRAGERAVAGLAPDEGVRWLRLALDACDERDGADELLRCRVLVLLGDAERQAGDPGYRERLLDAARLARRLGATDLLVDAALANTRGFISSSGEIDEEKVAVLNAALDAVGEGDLVRRSRLLAILAAELSWDDPSRRRAVAEEAVALARRSGDRRALLDALGLPTIALMTPDLVDLRLARTTEALAVAEELDDPVAEFSAMTWQTALALGDATTFSSWLARQRELAAQIGQPLLQWQAAFFSAVEALLAGDTERAEGLATQALQIGIDSGQPDATMFYGSQLISTRWQQGRLGELLEVIAQIAEDNPGMPVFNVVLAWAYVNSGDLDQARLLHQAARARRFELPYDVGWVTGTCLAGEVAAAVGDVEAARDFYDQLAPYGDQLSQSGITVEGPVHHYLGLLAAAMGEREVAEAHLRQSLVMAEGMGAPFFAARSALELGRLVGDRDVVRTALEVAQQRGYAALEAGASATLSSA